MRQGYELQPDLKNMKLQYQIHQKIKFCIHLHIDIWENTLYLQANPYGLKPRIIIASFLLAALINNANDIFCLIGLVFFRKEKGFLYINVLLHRVIV